MVRLIHTPVCMLSLPFWSPLIGLPRTSVSGLGVVAPRHRARHPAVETVGGSIHYRREQAAVERRRGAPALHALDSHDILKKNGPPLRGIGHAQIRIIVAEGLFPDIVDL